MYFSDPVGHIFLISLIEEIWPYITSFFKLFINQSKIKISNNGTYL